MATKPKKDEVIYPLRMSRTMFIKVQTLARAEDRNGAQFIRRAIRIAIDARKGEA